MSPSNCNLKECNMAFKTNSASASLLKFFSSHSPTCSTEKGHFELH